MEALRLIETRLQHCTEFRFVASALQLAAVTGKAPTQALMLYVVPESYTASSNRRSTGRIQQRLAETYGVVIAIKVVNDSLGSTGAERLTEAIQGIRKALHGWAPDMSYDPLELAGGRMIALQPGALFWLEKFSTAHHEEAANG